jgi:hypothetical protein
MPKAASTEVEDLNVETGDDTEQQHQDEGDEHEDETSSEGSETDAAGEDAGDGEGSDDEVVVTIGEESPPSDEDETRAAPWVRELRKSHRELQRKNRELEQRLQTATPAETAVVVGEEPTLAGAGYDEDKFKADWRAWNQRKLNADAAAAKKQKDAETAQAAWQATLKTYETAKAALKVKDAEDAEAAAKDVLSVTQQGLILQGAENPAVVVYALGKNPKKLKELASIADPVKFAFAVAKLETQLKVTTRKAAPLPDKSVRGGAPVSGTVDSTLARLRVEAEKTGDMSKVIAYKNQLRQKERSRG